jgi:hypothetical protein
MMVGKRVPAVLSSGCGLCGGHDIPRCAQIREAEPADLPLDLLDGWLGVRYVCQGVRYCGEIDVGGEEPVHASLDICLYYFDDCLYFDADELF